MCETGVHLLDTQNLEAPSHHVKVRGQRVHMLHFSPSSLAAEIWLPLKA